MATYSQTEKREMYELYISNNKNAARAAQEYEFLYPERRQPDRTTFLKIYRNMVECGSVQKSRGRYQARRERFNEINVLAQVHVNPEGSTLNFARECGTSSTTVKRILKDNHYHDYKFKPVQTLYPGDGDRRVAFCRWLQIKLMADINYIYEIPMVGNEIWTTLYNVTHECHTTFYPTTEKENNYSEKYARRGARGHHNRSRGGSPILPQKSRDCYEKELKKFTEWMDSRNVKDINENVLLTYFLHLKKETSPIFIMDKVLYASLDSECVQESGYFQMGKTQ
ncbi:hypothetical protein NQ315_012301 [Exocentrus adspersus]|uniref:Uncharacterized protein n=1 Tax=Exocentrus adspersus TaxID=1586481 RepID=A0AAV8VD03_9CUCU|nr:hypothetical protein NQ315_012301 [Exocentrus adspersus]